MISARSRSSWFRLRRRPSRSAGRRSPAQPTAAQEAVHVRADAARRDLGVDAALRVLDVMARMTSTMDVALRDQADPDVLDVLYRLDSLMCQARRIGENLHMLSDLPVVDIDRQVTAITDVIDAARCRIAGWHHVIVGPVAEIAVVAEAAGNLIRIMTEMLDNAERYSAADSPVTVSGHLLRDGGLLLRVEDSGVGMTAAELAGGNAVLTGAQVGIPLAVRGRGIPYGWHVIARAVAAHGMQAALTARNSRGTIASVYLPARLLTEIPRVVQARVS